MAPNEFPPPDPVWTAVDTYTTAHLHGPGPLSDPSPSTLSGILSRISDASLPAISVSPSQGKFLKLMMQVAGARHILEIGTLGGYSTVWLASAGPEVRIISVEVDPQHAAIARENIADAGFADRVEVRVGAGVEVLPRLVDEVRGGAREPFDFVFVDADKENNWRYVEMLLGGAAVKKGGLVVVDNVVRRGSVAQAGTGDSRVEGSREVVEKVGADERLDAVVMQTVGEKSYDGFLMAVVR